MKLKCLDCRRTLTPQQAGVKTSGERGAHADLSGAACQFCGGRVEVKTRVVLCRLRPDLAEAVVDAVRQSLRDDQLDRPTRARRQRALQELERGLAFIQKPVRSP